MHPFPLTVAAVDKIYFQGDVVSVTCPGRDGEVTILRHHVPFVTPLRPGTILIKKLDGEEEITVSRGILEVHKEGVTILL
jgi:F-type H+-transporting ATPase subunit epsilon